MTSLDPSIVERFKDNKSDTENVELYNTTLVGKITQYSTWGLKKQLNLLSKRYDLYRRYELAKNNSTKLTEQQILIAGAGPSGLLLALLLSQHNIPSIVLEAWPGLDTRLRATQYGVPATRIFRRAGVLDDIRAESIESFPTICWRRVADEKKLVSLDMSCVKDHPDRMTIMQLGEMIKIIYRHCVEKGKGLIDIRFQHRVVDVHQDGGKAWVDVEVGDEKSKQTIEADYVVGCDGATSAVRRSLFGREWPGQTFDYRFIVQNVSLDVSLGVPSLTVNPDILRRLRETWMGWRKLHGRPRALGLDSKTRQRRPLESNVRRLRQLH
jgi:2-polyprenyl-6-methoxyphenol hydroxylase-like FAD-dependent oxidoreductase